MRFKRIFQILFLLFIIFIVYFLFSLRISPPEQDLSVIDTTIKRTQQGDLLKYGNNWLKKERPGFYLMYAEGDGFERGYAEGMLTKELANEQESYFVEELNKKIPSKIYQFFLKVMVGWFNKDIDKKIPEEYKKEIYGNSLFASKDYDFIAPAYQRLLNYHAAHDIGHAVQNMHFVACTGLGAWNNYAEDNSMYVGRNFDFYVGDNFAKNKIINFINPAKGYKFMSISWGGMIGVLSGMNIEGLTVSLNADKSEIPSKTGTPVSIIGRDILQYASTIDEAYAIAKKHSCFVSESFLVASAKDKRIAIIEKTPSATWLYEAKEDRIIIANHFQSNELKNLPINKENISDSASFIRQERVAELMNTVPQLNEKSLAQILRNYHGLNNKSLGYGNERTINQFIAHHSVIFNPYKKLAWVSTSPYQLGEYMAIDLNKVFQNPSSTDSITISTLNIEEDPFLKSSEYSNLVKNKKTTNTINAFCTNEIDTLSLSNAQLSEFIKTNPDYYYTYYLIGEYFKKKENYTKAIDYYNLALSKTIASEAERKNIGNKIEGCKKEK